MTYKHLTIIERSQLEILLPLGFTQTELAVKLGVSASTISRELRRCAMSYTAEQAQLDYQLTKSMCGAKTKATPALKAEIEKAILQDRWSPEQFAGRAKKI